MAGIERKGQQLGSIRVEVIDEDVPLSKLGKDDLVKRAEAAGVDSSGTKADIIAALEKGDG